MKRYIIQYWQEKRSSPETLFEISEGEKLDGFQIRFWNDGRKFWQSIFKKNLPNGIYKKYSPFNPKDAFFQNWKKQKRHGIKIIIE